MLPALKRLQITSTEADRRLAASLLKEITASRSIGDGRELHCRIAKAGRDSDTFLGNLLVQMYAKCGGIDEARAAFERIHRKNIFSWNAILDAHCQAGDRSSAEIVLRAMPQRDFCSWTILVTAYADLGDLAAANSLLDQMPEKNPIAQTAVMAANARLGHIGIAIHMFIHMYARDITAFNAMLAAYSFNRLFEYSKAVFQKMPKWDLVSLNTLLSTLAELGQLVTAKRFFEFMPERDVVSWNSILRAFIESQDLNEATVFFNRMPSTSLVSWNSLIQCYAQQGYYECAIAMLNQIPGFDVFTWNLAIQSCSQTGAIDHAKASFDSMSCRDVVTWTTMLVAYVSHQDLQQASMIYENMPHYNKVAATAMLVAYSNAGNYLLSSNIFNTMLELDVVAWNAMLVVYAGAGHMPSSKAFFEKMPMQDACSWNSLLQAYGRHGGLGIARAGFDSMPERDAITFASMIAAYTQAGQWNQAFSLFCVMDLDGIKPDSSTYVSILNACAEHGALTHGKLIHTLLEEEPLDFKALNFSSICTSLVNLYGRCGCPGEARERILLRPGNRDRDLWNLVLGAYTRNGHHDEAVRLFKEMDVEGVGPDDRSYVAAIDACAGLADLALGRTIHVAVAESSRDRVASTALLNLYGSCGELESARRIFDAIPDLDKDAAAWNSIITQAGIRNRDACQALQLFRQMDLEGVHADEVTLARVAEVCATSASALELELDAARGTRNPALATSLLTMYARCGKLHDALAVFRDMPVRDAAAWNAVIVAYSLGGTFEGAAHAFASMQLAGVTPDGITFLALLTACSHAGKLAYGTACFAAMAELYGTAPGASHYVCMADLLSRMGHVERAESVIEAMPYEPVPAAWTTVLGACGSHGRLDRATHAARHALGVEPRDSSAYVLLYNALSRE